MDGFDEREEELTSLLAIYPELVIDPKDRYSATIDLPVAPSNPLLIRFIPSQSPVANALDVNGHRIASTAAYIERDVELSHLPPLCLAMSLPTRYPADTYPHVHLSTDKNWLPSDVLTELENEVKPLWEEYGPGPIMYSFIDHLQQAVDRGFDLDQRAEGCLVLPSGLQDQLVSFDEKTREAVFNAGKYDCGICLEPKKGSSCYKLPKCGHVFCKLCLQDFYNNAIMEGDVGSVKCLDPGCGKVSRNANGGARVVKIKRSLHPRDLLAMGLDDKTVRRYVEFKRKKKLESDKTTVYCPRQWCQGPAKSPKYPPLPADLSEYILDSSCDEDDGGNASEGDDGASPPRPPKPSNPKIPPDPSDRLAICEKCSLAFCRVCYSGWHGPYAKCFPRDPNELSAEEKASYDYIRLNTSPCPYCNSPTQKTHGCNHMKCFTCATHFCYLCTAWLEPGNPYQHFNKPGTECYQRLWELEEGDDGQGPADGRGFAGGRGWERMALEAAQEAEAQEAARAAQLEEDERAARALAEQEDVPVQPAIPLAAAARVEAHVNDGPANAPQQRQGGGNRRRQQNPFPANPRADGVANAVRNHERNVPARNVAPRPALNEDERHQAELQRFLNMAERDEEDGWDSDELGEDDDGFRIR